MTPAVDALTRTWNDLRLETERKAKLNNHTYVILSAIMAEYHAEHNRLALCDGLKRTFLNDSILRDQALLC